MSITLKNVSNTLKSNVPKLGKILYDTLYAWVRLFQLLVIKHLLGLRTFRGNWIPN